MSAIKNGPHTCVFFIEAEIHEKLHTGDLSGNPVHKEKKIFAIDAVNKDICIRRMNEFFNEVAKQCKA